MMRWFKLSLCVMFVAAAVATAGCGGDKPAADAPAAGDAAGDDAASEKKE